MATKKNGSRSSSNVVAQARGKGAPKRGGGRAFWENFKSLAGALVIYLFIKTFLIEAYRIPSGSMIPTLCVGDWLFVNKLIYGPTLPFTNSHLPGYASPKHGDVVVFVSPYQPDEAAIGNDPTPTLVKRLIGMPGDTLYMRDGLLYLNGIAQRQGYAAQPGAANACTKGRRTVYDAAADSMIGHSSNPLFDWQRRIEVRGSRFGAPPATPTVDNWGPLLIPAGHYWMMGDNRHQSKDSRFWGIVPRDNVRGRPLFVYYSFVPSEDSDRPVSWLTDIRWGRLGHWIQ